MHARAANEGYSVSLKQLRCGCSGERDQALLFAKEARLARITLTVRLQQRYYGEYAVWYPETTTYLVYAFV